MSDADVHTSTAHTSARPASTHILSFHKEVSSGDASNQALLSPMMVDLYSNLHNMPGN